MPLLQQPRKSSYRTIHPDAVGAASTAQRNVALDWGIACAAYVHSVTVVVMGTILLLSLWRSSSPSSPSSSGTTVTPTSTSVGVSSESVNSSSAVSPVWWLSSGTSQGQSTLFLLSSAYFLVDIIALHLRHRLHSSKGQRILTHHLLSIVGLLCPVVTGLDGPLVLLGFVLAESSNPPFHVLTLCRYATKNQTRLRCANPWLKRLAKPVLYICLSMDLSLFHVLVFVLTRLACLQFTAHAVMPYAHLASTKVTSIILCLLSALMFVDLMKTLQIGGGSSSSSTNGVKRQGWKQVMVELREMQSECDSTTYATGTSSASASGDEADHSGSGHHSRKRGSARHSAGNSPRHHSTDDSASAASSSDAAPITRRDFLKKKLFG